jgi:methionyl-tRNA formyltransferase
MRIVFMGTGDIAIPSLTWLINSPALEVVGVYTQPDKPVGRKQVLTPPEIKVLAGAAQIPVFQPESFRQEPEAIATLMVLRCDIAVVMAYGQILPKAVIQAPKIACVNLHASLLPRHRGASPIQAAIRAGDSRSGLTLMHISPKLDAGDMILHSKIELAEDETGGSLHDRLAELGPALLKEGLPLLFSGKAPRISQDETSVTHCGKLGREDGRINWQQSATEIERLVRAYDPWPGTSTILPSSKGDRQLKLFPGAQIGISGGEEPGTVLDDPTALKIACGSGTALRFTGDMQIEGKTRMPIRNFLKGAKLERGLRLP